MRGEFTPKSPCNNRGVLQAVRASVVVLWVLLQLVLLGLYFIFFVQWLGWVGLILAVGFPPLFIFFPVVYWLSGGISAATVFLLWVPLWVGGVMVAVSSSDE